MRLAHVLPTQPKEISKLGRVLPLSLKNMARRLPRPIKDFVRRKLNERGFYDLGDGRDLNERGFYDIRGVGEITTIDEFKGRAFAIQKRSRLQTQEDVTALKKNMSGRSLAKLQWNHCLSFRLGEAARDSGVLRGWRLALQHRGDRPLALAEGKAGRLVGFPLCESMARKPRGMTTAEYVLVLAAIALAVYGNSRRGSPWPLRFKDRVCRIFKA
jgi:hypothetical protein